MGERLLEPQDDLVPPVSLLSLENWVVPLKDTQTRWLSEMETTKHTMPSGLLTMGCSACRS